MADETPWYAPDHPGALHGKPCSPRPREAVWTLVKGGKRVDAELMFHGEYGVEAQFLHEGVMAYGRRFPLRELALQEAEEHRQRLIGEGWTAPVTSPPADEG